MASNVDHRPRRGGRRSLTLDGANDEILDVDGLLQWIQNDPETAWKILCKRMKDIEDLKNQVAALTGDHLDEITDLREQLAAQERAIAQDQQVEEEYARLRTKTETLRKERDSLLTVMNLMRTTPAAAAGSERGDREASLTSAFGGSKKSTKMPDPLMFSDGKEVKFKDWKSEMKRKLLLNEDHYPTPAHQLAYVSSRCEGKALRHINPRMQEDAATAYQTIQYVFDHLQSVFHDPNHQQVARDEYLALKIDPKQDFGDFLAEITYLAEESDQPTDLRKRDLYRKLPALLQNQVMIDAIRDSVSLDEFVQKSQIAARLISQQIANRAENRNNNKSSRTGGIRLNPNMNNQDRKPTNCLDDKEKAALLKEGRYFACREQGHVSRNCPSKSQSAATAAAANQDNKAVKDLEDAEANKSSDSGKESTWDKSPSQVQWCRRWIYGSCCPSER